MSHRLPARHPRVDYTMIEAPADLELMQNRTQFVVDHGMVRRRWREMENLIDSVVVIDPENRREQLFPLDRFFRGLRGVSVAPPRTVFASYRGDSPFAAEFRLFSAERGERAPLLEALHVDCSVHAFVEAVYLAFHLPTRIRSLNTVYAADYALLLDDRSDWTHLPQGRGMRNLIDSVDRPFGIRVCKRRDRYYVSCLVAFSNGGIVDRALRVHKGSLSILPSPDVVRERRLICEIWI